MPHDTGSGYDFESLGIDVARHGEVLDALARLQVDQRSIKPVLAARELAVGEFAGTSIWVRVGGDERRITSALGAVRLLKVQPIAQASNHQEAVLIRSDVERYFARHFPGRCRGDVSTTEDESALTVFVVFGARS